MRIDKMKYWLRKIDHPLMKVPLYAYRYLNNYSQNIKKEIYKKKLFDKI